MKFTRKLTVTLLTLALVLGCVPYTTTEVQAAPKVDKSLTTYLIPDRWNTKGIAGGYIAISGLRKSFSYDDLDKMEDTIKCSKRNFLSFDGTEIEKRSTWIGITAEKPGTATVSFKIDKKEFKTKVYVKKYTNPVRSVSITGVEKNGNTNLAKYTNRNSETPKLDLTRSTVKDPKIKITAKKDWKIDGIYYMGAISSTSEPAVNDSGSKTYKKPVSKAAIGIFNKTKKLEKGAGGYNISVGFINTKNNARINVRYFIDVNPKDVIDGVG